jgi:hypothetical protein
MVRIKSESRQEEIVWEDQESIENAKCIENICPQFVPRLKKAGELLLASDWNDMQIELKKDIENICRVLKFLSTESMLYFASGITSHGVFVELGWDITPIVLMSFSGPIKKLDIHDQIQFRCYPYDVSQKGFRVYARSIHGNQVGVVNWIAFNLKPVRSDGSC